MPITFNCPCGKILSSRESDAGLKAICPSCGRRVMVPGQIQTPPEATEQLRRAALKFDSWMHGQQRAIWKLSIATAVLLVVGLVGYKFWRDGQRRRIVERHVAHVVAKERARIVLDPNADPEQWLNNFESFAVAIKQSMAKNELLQDKFTGKQIVWDVTFDELLERGALYFREAEPLREGDRGVLVWASVLPSQIEVAERLRPGQRIRLRGRMGPVLKGRSAEHPLGNVTVRPLECSVEILAEEPAANAPPENAPILEDSISEDPASEAASPANSDATE